MLALCNSQRDQLQELDSQKRELLKRCESLNAKLTQSEKRCQLMKQEQEDRELLGSQTRHNLDQTQIELKDLKVNFNSHMIKIKKEFVAKLSEKEKDAAQLTHKIESLSADLQQAVEENGNLEAKIFELESILSKTRAEQLQDKIKNQQHVRQLEERLSMTEQMLIKVKASWAESEH